MEWKSRAHNKELLGTARTQTVRFDWNRWSRPPVPPPLAGSNTPIRVSRDVPQPVTPPLYPTSTCKYCHCPIAWGQVNFVFGQPQDKRRWLPLDPDWKVHMCQRWSVDLKSDENGTEDCA